MVTRSRTREGRGISVVPETQLEPEPETRQEQEVPKPHVSITTCEGGLGAARPSTTDTADDNGTADKPEITASHEISSSLLTENTQIFTPHTDPIPPIPHTSSKPSFFVTVFRRSRTSFNLCSI